MGELISMIAHQWRQPLGAISAVSADLRITMQLKTFDLTKETGRNKCLDYLYQAFDDIDTINQSLTDTIEYLSALHKADRESTKTLINDPIHKALEMINPSFTSHEIEVSQEYKSRQSIEIYYNEITQVILNLLTNALDNFRLKSTVNPKLSISTKDEGSHVVIKICDNGGKVPEDIVFKMFDPYFSTKEDKNGKGLSLYLSKQIIEDHHTGKLHATNTDDGLCFTIELGHK